MKSLAHNAASSAKHGAKGATGFSHAAAQRLRACTFAVIGCIAAVPPRLVAVVTLLQFYILFALAHWTRFLVYKESLIVAQPLENCVCFKDGTRVIALRGHVLRGALHNRIAKINGALQV